MTSVSTSENTTKDLKVATPRRPEVMRQKARALKVYGLLALAVCLAVYVAVFARIPVGPTAAWGAFGDYLSGVAGTAIAVLTLSAVADTLALQAEELAETRAIVEKQAETATRQVFDSTFFRLLEHFGTFSRGEDVQDIALKLRADYAQDKETRGSLKQLEATYKRQYDRKEHILGPYFRTLFHLLKFVDKSDLKADEKHSYVSLVRAGLSTRDLILILVNVIANAEGRKGLRPFVEDYGLLKHASSSQELLLEDFRLPGYGLKPAAFQSREQMRAAQPPDA